MLSKHARAQDFVACSSVVRRTLGAAGQAFFAQDVAAVRTGAVAAIVLATASPVHAISSFFAAVVARLIGERIGANRSLTDGGLIELNAWFVGLACASFFAPGLGLFAALLIATVAVPIFAVAVHRVLGTWNLPLMVAAYMPAFWITWLVLSGLPWTGAAVPVAAGLAAPTMFMQIVLGGLRGIGQIFFLPHAGVGLGFAVAVSLSDRRGGLMMIGASTVGVGIGAALGAPAWQVEQGLHGFTPALVALAAASSFRGLAWPAAIAAMVAAPALEMAALKLSNALGLPALSSAYVGLFWLLFLAAPVRSSGLRPAWTARGAS